MNTCNLRCACLVLLMIALCASEAFALAVGYTPGQFSVGDSGQATYSIPLIVPPGTAGMQPALSLNYNSGAGNDLLGQGWGLGGLSQITRCPTTKAQDNSIDGVDFDALDRFCLDGQRLRTVGGHTYGGNGAVYRTEIDTFSRIISYGVAGNGPAYFTVETRDGKIIEYGNTPDSRIEAQGKSSARTWAVNKISDHAGNYMTITYTEDTTNGEFRPSQIDYTGHERTAPTLSPYAKVEFIYVTRTDQELAFLGGSQIKTTQRLTNIKSSTTVNNVMSLVRDYFLIYDNYLGINGASRITDIKECDAAGNCFPPSTFTWEGNGSLPVMSTVMSNPVWSSYNFISGDWNGDGRTDLFLQSKTGVASQMYTANAQGTMVATGFNPTGWYGAVITGDWNGDGRTDMLRTNSTQSSCFDYNGVWTCIYSHHAYLYTSTGTAMTSGQTLDYGYTTGDAYPLFPLDWNGDGRTDLGTYGYSSDLLPQNPVFFIANANGTMSDSGIVFPYLIKEVGDWNGDGMDDVLTFNGQQGQLHHSTGTNFELAGSDSSFNWAAARLITGDWNGDGNTDLFATTSTQGKLYLSRGDGTLFATGYNPTDWYYYRFVTGDWNGDGKTDLGRLHNTNQTANFYISTGTSMATANYNPAWGGTKYVVTGDWNGDGLSDLWLSNTTNGQTTTQYKTTHSGFDFVKNFRDGLGHDTKVTYAALTEGSPAEGGIYTKSGIGTYPDLIVQTPMRVVDTVTVDDGNKAFRNFTYYYEDARINLQGRGFLGFATVSGHDDGTNLDTITDYRQDFPYIGLSYNQDLQTGTTLLSRTVTTYNSVENWTGEKVYFPYASQVVISRYELNGGALLATETTVSTYDMTGSPAQTPRTWGNPTVITETLTGGGDIYTTATTNVFNNTPATWLIGQLSRTTVTKTSVIPPEPTTSTTRVSSFLYHATTGLLTDEFIEPDDTYNNCAQSLCLHIAYTPDAYGNRLTTTTSGADIISRSTINTYDPRGQFIDTVTNDKGHVENQDWNVKYGVMDVLSGPNGVITKWEYDGFGQRTKEYRAYLTPQQTTTDYSYNWCPGSPGDDGASPLAGWCESSKDSAYRVEITTIGKPVHREWFDSVGRQYLVGERGFTGDWGSARYIFTKHDVVGNVYQRTRPYHGGSTQLWTTYTYDALGRQRTETAPGNRVTTITYTTTGGATPRAKKTIVNAEYQTSQEVYNARGELVQAIDAQNGQTNYIYDPYGNLKIVRSVTSLGAIDLITNTYDTRGRKTASNDKDMGAWSYTYTVLDELKTQTNARGHLATMGYDTLGRMTSRIEPEGTATWTYDTAANGLGKIHIISSPEGKTETYAYDSIGRVSTVTTAIDGTNYTVSQNYDSASRVNVITYPVSIQYPYGLKVKQNYNVNGYLSAVTNDATGAPYWTETAQDAAGQTTTATYGNGVITSWGYDANTGFIDTLVSVKGAAVIQDTQYDFDKLGNLKRRDDLTAPPATPTYETFNYDSLNRLDDATTVEGGQSLVKDYNYDALGNLKDKTGIGAYTYVYTGPRPHASTSIAGRSQSYDGDGNLTSGWNFTLGQVRTAAYTSYDKPWRITQGSTILYFDHDAERQRFKQVHSNGRTIRYIGNLYEKETQGTATTHTHYIRAGGRLVAIYKSGTGGLNTLRYVHTDHLGSITEITNETGGLVESLSYDPWGKRRNADWSDAAGQLYASHTKRSFTGHEYLEDAGLIHMNGRVYDPDMGRMLSPDPFINQPANPQSYNRYSYVLNNPLSYTDPSGYQEEIEEVNVNGTRIHIRPLDLKTGLGAAFLFSNSSASYPVVGSSFFVLTPLVPVTVNRTPTGSHISRKQTVYVNNPFASRIPPSGVKVAGDVKGSKALEYANGKLSERDIKILGVLTQKYIRGIGTMKDEQIFQLFSIPGRPNSAEAGVVVLSIRDTLLPLQLAAAKMAAGEAIYDLYVDLPLKALGGPVGIAYEIYDSIGTNLMVQGWLKSDDGYGIGCDRYATCNVVTPDGGFTLP